MMRGYIVTRLAEAEIDEIADRIADSNLIAGARFYRAAIESMERLVRNPASGSIVEMRDKSKPAIRVKPIRDFNNYLIFYQIVDEQIEVFRVLHGARDWVRLQRQGRLRDE